MTDKQYCRDAYSRVIGAYANAAKLKPHKVCSCEAAPRNEQMSPTASTRRYCCKYNSEERLNEQRELIRLLVKPEDIENVYHFGPGGVRVPGMSPPRPPKMNTEIDHKHADPHGWLKRQMEATEAGKTNAGTSAVYTAHEGTALLKENEAHDKDWYERMLRKMGEPLKERSSAEIPDMDADSVGDAAQLRLETKLNEAMDKRGLK